MGLLSREGMRDGNIGICWDAGHIGICGICGEDGGYAEICGICGDMWDMRDGPPPRNQPGRAAVFGPTPPTNKGWETETANDQRAKKKNAYFVFNLLIINHINQYFNIHLHLIRFITYNRRIFIAKYLLDNKTCCIFALVR